jgi:hypothetical protein
MMDETLIRARLELPLEENYFQLGTELLEGREFAEEPTRENLTKRARTWLALLSARIRQIVCSNARIGELMSSPSANRQVLLVAAIADLISSMVVPVSPWTASVLLVQEGMHRLCPDLAKSDTPADDKS